MSSRSPVLDYHEPHPPAWQAWIPAIKAAFALLLIAVAVISIAAYSLHRYAKHIHRDRRVAVLSGPDGAAGAYEIWWNPLGDLRFVQPGVGTVASRIDFYDDVTFTRLDWLPDGDALLTTVENVQIRFSPAGRLLKINRTNATSTGGPRSLTAAFPTTTLSDPNLARN